MRSKPGSRRGPSLSKIQLRGVRTHNLQGFDLDLPKEKLIVISGPSGSGKSSLAVDTIFAEGQRRFVESQSVAAQYWLEKVKAAPCDEIRGLTPTIALRARRVSGYARTTVGTLSEVYDLLRLLYARCGTDDSAKEELGVSTVQELVSRIEGLETGSKYALIAPIFEEPEMLGTALAKVVAQGYSRITVDDELLDPSQVESYRPPAGQVAPRVEVYVDRLIAKPTLTRARIADSVELALRLGQGRIRVRVMAPSEQSFDVRCEEGASAGGLERSATLFSFNTPLGACPACEGKGMDDEGKPCGVCQQTRLNPEARAVKIAAKDIGEMALLSLERLHAELSSLSFADSVRQAVADQVLPKIFERLSFMMDLGLGYLSLHRGVDTLSGGEIQRLRLARQIGSELVGVTYILDEPSIGLHPKDRPALIEKLQALRDRGNTVIVVEHDESILRAADYVVELGPGAGKLGGQLVACGTPDAILAHEESACAALLRGELRVSPSLLELSSKQDQIRLQGADGHNLKKVDLEIPLARWTCISGVSGSGKSTLISKTLRALALRDKMGAKATPLSYRSIQGLESIERVIAVNDAPLKAGARSNPATYTGIFAEIRSLFAALPASKIRGFKANRFSFNAKGGRCETCLGEGVQRLSMQWMADLVITCPTCKGLRYTPDTLEVKYRGHSIAQVLSTRVDEACELFVRHKKLMGKLELMRDVGLGYLQLGQSLATLSRGELARLKLAKELGRSSQTPTLYILDEPSTGLHEKDIAMLSRVLRRLVGAGHTVVVVEHHLSLIAASDWVVDMGPGAGAKGGHIVATGTPSQLAKDPQSVTGPYLAAYWKL